MNRLYIPRALGGRDLLSIEDSIIDEEQSLSAYLLSTSEPLRLVKTFFTFSSGLFGSQYKESVVRSHQELYLAKPLHGQFMCDIGNDYDRKLQWSWLC